MAKRSVSGRAAIELPDEHPPSRDPAPNNLRHGSNMLALSTTNEEGQRTGLSALQAYQRKLVEMEVPLPSAALMVDTKQREMEIKKLQDMVAVFAEGQKRYTSGEISSWQGLTPIVEEVIIQALRTGLPRRRAVAMAGISLHKLKQWLDMGEQGLSPFAAFALRFHQVEGFDELKATQLVREAASAELKTAGTYLKLLERRYKPEDEQWDAIGDVELPFDRFTTAELEAYTNSGGKVVPDRFKRGVTVDATDWKSTSDEENRKDEEIAKLRQELAEARGSRVEKDAT